MVRSAEARSVYVALLRAVNVGGNNSLPMTDLASTFRKMGCSDVATYIQSGNVVYSIDETRSQGIAESAERSIKKQFGFTAPVVTFSLPELQQALRGYPFADLGIEEKFRHIGFLKEAPSKNAIASLDPARSPGDQFLVKGRLVYLAYGSPGGVAKTKLTSAYFDSKLGTTITARNLRTVGKLVEMGEELDTALGRTPTAHVARDSIS